MKNKITLENLSEFSIPLFDHPLKWKFENDEEKELSDEFNYQIIALNPEASKFLWNFRSTQRILNTLDDSNHFNEFSEFSYEQNENKEVKKWLYQRGIPFDQKYFGRINPILRLY